MGCIMLVYSCSAQILFGTEVVGFENFGRCFITVCRTLLGDFDFDAMIVIGWPEATLWFITFVILLNMVMLNMLLAIVMDVYGKTRDQLADDAETLWSQTYEISRRWLQKNKGQRLSLDQIARQMRLNSSELKNAIGEPKLLTVTALMKLVEGLSADQAERVLIGAEQFMAGSHASRTKSTIKVLDLRVQHVQHSLQVLHGTIDALQAVNDSVKNGVRLSRTF